MSGILDFIPRILTENFEFVPPVLEYVGLQLSVTVPVLQLSLKLQLTSLHPGLLKTSALAVIASGSSLAVHLDSIMIQDPLLTCPTLLTEKTSTAQLSDATLLIPPSSIFHNWR